MEKQNKKKKYCGARETVYLPTVTKVTNGGQYVIFTLHFFNL